MAERKKWLRGPVTGQDFLIPLQFALDAFIDLGRFPKNFWNHEKDSQFNYATEGRPYANPNYDIFSLGGAAVVGFLCAAIKLAPQATIGILAESLPIVKGTAQLAGRGLKRRR